MLSPHTGFLQDAAPDKKEQRRTSLVDCVLLGMFWILAVAAVNPIGEFPLNDDFAFAQTVRQLYQNGIYQQPSWGSMTFISQSLWGLLFCLPAGFSFTALRFSTIILGFAGVSSTYFLLRELGGGRSQAWIGSLAVASNPIYFALSHTFMTDVPFTAANTLAAYFFVRAIKSDSVIPIVAATFFGLLGMLCRQIGIVLMIIFCIVYPMQKGLSLRSIARAGLPLLIALLALFAFEHWLTATHTMPKQYNAPADWMRVTYSKRSWSQLLLHSFLNLVAVLLYAGLFLGPFLIVISGRYVPRLAPKIVRRIVVMALLIFLGAILTIGKPMPVLQNILVPEGIGPVTLHDSYILGISSAPTLPGWFWILVTCASVVGAVVLVLFVVDGVSNSRTLSFLFLISVSAVLLAPIVLIGVWDRYVLPALPLLMGATLLAAGNRPAHAPRQVFQYVCILTILITSLFSISITHDYLQWNRTRWEALNELRTKEGIDASQIDGGMEYNGWYLYDPEYKRSPDKSWWWVHGNQYMIAMQEVSGYEAIRTYPYSRWVPPNQYWLLLLRKTNSTAANVHKPRGLGQIFQPDPARENFSFFMLGVALQSEHPEKDCFELAFESAMGQGDTASQLLYVEQKSAEIQNLRGYQKDFRAGLSQIARIILNAQLAFESKQDAWHSVYNNDRFREEFSSALVSFQNSGDIGKAILKQLEKAGKKIDRNNDSVFSDQEIKSFLTPKLQAKNSQ